MPSISTLSISPAPKKTRPITKIYCTTPSFTRLKKNRAHRGKKKIMIKPQTTSLSGSKAQ